jgi:hypothetical protein
MLPVWRGVRGGCEGSDGDAGVTELVDVIARGDHVFLVWQSSQVPVQDQDEWSAWHRRCATVDPRGRRVRRPGTGHRRRGSRGLSSPSGPAEAVSLGSRRAACRGGSRVDTASARIDHVDASDNHSGHCLVAVGDGSDKGRSVRVLSDVDLPEQQTGATQAHSERESIRASGAGVHDDLARAGRRVGVRRFWSSAHRCATIGSAPMEASAMFHARVHKRRVSGLVARCADAKPARVRGTGRKDRVR